MHGHQLSVSCSNICRILKYDFKIKPYKIQKAHYLTPKQQQVRFKRAKELLRLPESGQFRNIMFSQNDRVYLTDRSYSNLSHLLAIRKQHPPQITVWAADERSPIVYIEPGVKINAKYYRENIMEVALKPWADKHFAGIPWTFQQDSASSHKARSCLAWAWDQFYASQEPQNGSTKESKWGFVQHSGITTDL